MEREILKCVRQMSNLVHIFWKNLSKVIFFIYFSFSEEYYNKWMGQLRGMWEAKNILKCALQMDRFGGVSLIIFVFILFFVFRGKSRSRGVHPFIPVTLGFLPP